MKKLLFALILSMLVFVACSDNDYENGYYPAEEITEAPPIEADDEPQNEDPYPAPIVQAEPVQTLIYSLALDEDVQALAQGTYGAGHDVFADTPNLMQSGSPVFTIVTHPSGEGNSIHLSGRAQNFYALDIYFPPLELSFGATYVFRATGRAPEDTGMSLGRTDAPWSAYATATVPASGEWQVEHTLADNELLEHFLSNQRGVRIMTNNAPTENFYVDSIEVIRIGERGYAEPIIPEWDLALPSLAEVFSQYFLLGNIWSTQSRMDSFNTTDGFLHHFNAVTAENNHKVDTIARYPGTWTFTTADHIVNWAEENDLAMIGHTLVWHSQSPPWLTTVPGTNDPLTRAQAIENMHLYISTVASRYAGRIYSWDVLNEVIWGVDASRWNANPDWRSHLRGAGRGLYVERQSQWYNAFANGANTDAGECGSDFVYYAFRFARIYDPFAILYYNDYNDHVPGKRDAIAQMVIQINERWQNDPLYDGRLLIEGIGMQAHYSITGWMTEPHHVRTAIELYITTGARISITEWDIVLGGGAQNPLEATPERLQAQADRFELLMGWYLEFSDYIGRVSLWGLADHQSWISWGSPLLFDENFRPKPAFFALLNALENAPSPNISVPVVSAANIPNGRANAQFAYQLSATQNNFAPILWSITDGELPPGLRLVSTTGVIMGTPTQRGTFTFTAEAANALGGGTQTFTITVN